MKRALKLNEKQTNHNGDCVVYWTSREHRVSDNFALIEAAKLAKDMNKPLVVVFNLLPSTGHRASEHYAFMIAGLKVMEESLRKLNIEFTVTNGRPTEKIPALCEALKPAALFADFSPLRGPRAAIKTISDSALFPIYVVDSHNIIPVWQASKKQEFAAYTFRKAVHKNLEEWLVEPEKLPLFSKSERLTKPVDWNSFTTVNDKNSVNNSVIQVMPGEHGANDLLQTFLTGKINDFAANRNDPTLNATSNVSAHLHFGHIAAIRIALEAMKCSNNVPLLYKEARLAKVPETPNLQTNIDVLLEELIVRKELADNFCFYNKNYDNINGAHEWAQKTLSEHEHDKRDFIYTKQQWESAQTHDPAWNAAQLEMMQTGKMHGYMRMYWAKKLLEWSPSPSEAIETAVYLNDHYSLDGGDPNGYAGILWSIAGLHDRAWNERPVFGKIRYMNYAGLKRKFAIDTYQKRWLPEVNSTLL